MGRFTAKYSHPQRQAVVRAMLDDGYTGPATVRAAAAGQLEGITAPFDIPLATVYWLAGRERERGDRHIREALLTSEPPEVVLQRITRTLLEIVRAEAERLLFAYERGEPDHQRLRWLIRHDRELRKLVPTDFPYDGLRELDHIAERLTRAVDA